MEENSPFGLSLGVRKQAIVDKFPWVNLRGTGSAKKALVIDLQREGRWAFSISSSSALNQVWDYIANNFKLKESVRDCSF